MTPQDFNNIVCAEIPDDYIQVKSEDENGYKKIRKIIYDLVHSFLLHGPCEPNYSSKACAKEGYCRYGFLKEYISITEMCEDNFLF